MKRGYFITFEGIEGCGKSTQINLTEKYLINRNHEVIRVREPGGTYAGEKIRYLLKHDEEAQLNPKSELLLFMASRVELVEKVIRPAVAKGSIVLADRFLDSSEAYQGIARNLGSENVNWLNKYAITGMIPDLTILLDLAPEVGFARINLNGRLKDKIEREAISFHRAVREGYLIIAKREKDRFEVIEDDRGLGEEYIQNRIQQALKKRLGL